MTAHDIHALSGAYAVDALDDVERARFEQHLAVCAECLAEVAGLRETGALLGSAEPVAPPPALRDRLMDDIRSVRPLPPVVRPLEPVPATRPVWRRLAVAAAVIAVVGGGTATIVELTRDDPSVVASPIDRVLTAADAEAVTVDLPGEGRLRLVRSVSQGKAVLVTRGLAAPPSGKVYQLWLQDPAGRFVSAGLMSKAGDRQVLLEGDAARAKGAGITVEESGGAEQPTSAPLALFDLSRAT